MYWTESVNNGQKQWEDGRRWRIELKQRYEFPYCLFDVWKDTYVGVFPHLEQAKLGAQINEE